MANTREQLVAATKELLWERGYEATSPRAILEKSGAGQGSFYHHFSSKAALAAAALQEAADDMRCNLEPILHSNAPALQRIRDYLTMPREELRGCRIGRMTHEPIIRQDETLRDPIVAYFSYAEQELATVLAEAQREGALSENINVDDLAATLLATVQGGYVLARGFQDPERMHQAIRGALTLIDSIEQKKEV
ncbi:TetR family transcriptional regulator [Reticulibacter mediterranei]|uniref:TetR family transcriptional regulator n=1 Tax=Reticulibacter mediterranei TaxID=2778369 RepID=A0A8J3IQ79_9CHLR|nr:TetR/AcrR family transcriptional regulator [Reticulibacter mediterranei]GHO98193.1 TetR family transcriptional regulator [Reticulibacter mediterranei]